MSATEKVDILKPPTFEKSGVVKELKQAWADENWIGTFNLWIVQTQPVPSIVYQQRSPRSSWAPGKLDVSAGGHYSAGEQIMDGMREVQEELGKHYDLRGLVSLGRRVNVSPDIHGHMRNNVVDIFMVKDNESLDTYALQPEEVFAIVVCPIAELLKVHEQQGYRFKALGISADNKKVSLDVDSSVFPYNWDNYHYKMAILANRFAKGEPHLLY